MDVKDIYDMQDAYSKNVIAMLKIRPNYFTAYC